MEVSRHQELSKTLMALQKQQKASYSILFEDFWESERIPLNIKSSYS